MILELFLAASLATAPAAHSLALQEERIIEQADDDLPADDPRADDQDDQPIWFWFSTCSGPLLALDVRLDERVVFEARFPICHALQSSPRSQGQKTRLSFSFTPTRPIEWRGYRDDPDTSPAQEPLRIDLWEAGADPDALILGVSAMGSDRIYMNTLHVAVPDERRASEIARGLTVSTYPAEAAPKTEGTAPDARSADSGQRLWVLANDELLSWEEAEATCRDLVSDGFDDWRLPSIQEMAFLGTTIPTTVDALVEHKGIGAWACNPFDAPSTRLYGQEAREIERLAIEERELERKLCQLEGNTDCPPAEPRPRRWQYSFVRNTPRHGEFGDGYALCVRGGRSDCRPAPASIIRCLTTAHSSRWSTELQPDVAVEGVHSDGSRVAIGHTDNKGVLCVPEETALGLAVIMACDGQGCGAFKPRESDDPTLIVDEPEVGKRKRKGRFCLALRESRTDTPVCGAEIEGVTDTGRITSFGETGPRGRECVRREKLESVQVLLACVFGTCRAVPRSQFTSSKEVLLSLPSFYSFRAEGKNACRAAREHGIPSIQSHNHRQ